MIMIKNKTNNYILWSNHTILDLKQINKIKNGDKLFILSEITWDGHKYTDFFGYDFAMKHIIEKKLNVDLAFVSFLTREQLKKKTENSRLLAPIFPHFQLPVDFDKIEIPHISDAKWDYIRNYMLEPEKGGLIDKIAHDIKNIYFSLTESEFINSEKLKNVSFLLNNFKKYLPDEVISEQKYFEIEKINDRDKLRNRLEDLQRILERNYNLKTKSFVKRKLSKTKYKVLLIDDEQPILEELENKLKPYFDVVSFTNGTDALAELKKNPKLISAAFIDIELLNSDGGWQETFGIDIVEEAIKHPHLAVYMTTGLSKRAYSLIQTNLKSKFEFEPKPVRKSLEELYEQLIKIIKEKQKYLKGPQIGPWSKGLYQSYLNLKASSEWDSFLQSVYDDLKPFLEGDFKGFSALYGEHQLDKHKITPDILKVVLKHRIANLYLFEKSGSLEKRLIDFDKVKLDFGLPKSYDAKKYYATMLGLSTYNDKQRNVLLFNMSSFLPEERKWIEENTKTEDPSILYPTLWDEIDWYSTLLKTKLKIEIVPNSLPSINNLFDTLYKNLTNLNRQTVEEVKERIDFYLEDEESENDIRKLKLNPEGNKIIKLLKAILK